MLRVLYILPSLATSGETHQVLTLAGEMRLRGVEVHLCSLAPLSEAVFGHDFPIYSCGVRPGSGPLFAQRLRHILRTVRPQVVHCWETPETFRLRLTFRVKKYTCAWNPKVVTTIRRTDPFRDWDGNRSPGLDSADVLVATNPAVRDFYQNAGVRVSWRIVPDGVAAKDFPERGLSGDVEFRQTLLSELMLPEETILVGCVGPIRPEKRGKWAIWSLDSIIRIHPTARLLFIGNDAGKTARVLLPADGNNSRRFPLRGRLETFARQYQREDSVFFLSDRPDVPKILPCLDLLWVPQSVFGSSVSVIQAMLAGVPIIATETDGIRELLPEGTACLVPVCGEPLQIASHSDKLLENPEMAAAQTRAARRHAMENFTVERMAGVYHAMYTG